MSDPNKSAPVLSAQQILRARYKQQMMPPRTWKQQQARQEQMEALDRSKQASARKAFTATAAKTFSLVAQASQQPIVLEDVPSSSTAAEQPAKPLYVLRRCSSASSNASSTTSLSHCSGMEDLRPPLVRRGSSTSSCCRTAVLAAQNSVSRSPHDHSASSKLSSLVTSRRVSSAAIENSLGSPLKMHFSLPSSQQNSPTTKLNHLRPAQLRPLQTETLPTSGLPSKGVLSHGLPKTMPVKLPPTSKAPKKAAVSHELAPQQTFRSSQANAAAFASVRRPITVEPQATLSSKFVSTLTQALRKQQRLRFTAEEDRALEAISDSSTLRLSMSNGRQSQDSVRSMGSTFSAKSGRSSGSQKQQSYTISPDSFLDFKKQQQKQHQLQIECRLRALEENKANALRAAVAAGSRVETDMACIHIQVNEAVQTALQHQSRKMATQKYRPAASWSSTRIFRPKLRKLQTSDSLKEGGDLATFLETPSLPKTHSVSPVSGPLSAITVADSSTTSLIPSPGSASLSQPEGSSRPMALQSIGTWNQKSESEVSLVDYELGNSPGSQNLLQKWTCEPLPKVNITTIPSSKQTTKPAGRFLSTLRTQPRVAKQSRNREIIVRDPWPSQNLSAPNSLGGSPIGVLRSSMEIHSGLGFRQPSSTRSAEPQLQLQPIQQRMPKTLRNSGNTRFNQEKPWKGHREASELSERERKRYESLWAANKDVHLPYMCVPVKYQKPWMEALLNTLPELFNQKPGTHLSISADLCTNTKLSTRLSNLAPSVSSLSYRSTSLSVNKYEGGSEVELDQSFTDSDVESEVENDNLDMNKELAKWRNDVHGYVVARLWRRSCLPEDTLEQVWDLVDSNKDGTLDRSSFVVGMWLCDQCLYGRKLPSKVPVEVWQSVGRLNLKVRFEQKRSRIGYVTSLPNFFSNIVGLTVHGGRQIVKKTVQNATK